MDPVVMGPKCPVPKRQVPKRHQQPSVAQSVADILHPAKSNGSSESREKNLDTKPASDAAAADHLAAYSSAAAHIPGAIPNCYFFGELVNGYN